MTQSTNLLPIIFAAALCPMTDAYSAEQKAPHQEYDKKQSISIGVIFDDPVAYDKRHVIVTGLASEQEGRGRWFYLEDQTARIYVETPPAFGNISGKTVTVRATVHVKQGVPTLIATSVE